MAPKGKKKPTKKQPSKTTEPQATNKNVENKHKGNDTVCICTLCKSAGDSMSHMWVQCDKCDHFYHFTCVGISDIGEDDPWMCLKCEENERERSNEQSSEILQITDTSVDGRADKTNIMSVSGEKSLELQVQSVNQETGKQKTTLNVPVMVHKTNARMEESSEIPQITDTSVDGRADSINGEKSLVRQAPSVHQETCKQKSTLNVPVEIRLTNARIENPRENPGVVRGYDTIESVSQLNSSSRPSLPVTSTRADVRISNATFQAPPARIPPVKPRFYQGSDEEFFKIFGQRLNPNVNPSQKSLFHATGQPMFQSLVHKSQNQPIMSKIPEVHVKKGTDAQSIKSGASKVRSQSSKTSSMSSQLRRDVELIRIQEELELQTKLDEERLKLERYALDQKEKREKKFLEEKHKVLMDSDGSRASAKSKAGSQTSRRYRTSENSAMVENWVKEQRNQNAFTNENAASFNNKIDNFNYETSIPVYPHEWDRLKNQEVNDQNIKKNEEKPPLTSTGTKNLNPNATTFRISDHSIGPVIMDTGKPGHHSTDTNQLPNLPLNPNYPPMYTDFSEIPQYASNGPSRDKNVPPGKQQAINNQRQSMLTANQIAARHTVPKELPIFNGNPADWPRFIRKFVNTTRMCGLTDDENIERLDKCLQGQARRIVESQLAFPDCVREIIETLREKFGRPELVVNAILTDLRKEAPIKPDKLEALSNFGYQVRNACTSIEALGLRFYLNNPELIREIVGKLPYQTRIDWARDSEKLPQITMVELSNWLHSLARTLNRITIPEVPSSSSDKKTERKPENYKIGQLNYHERSTPNENNQSTPQCMSCSKSCNNVGECSKFKSLTVDEKWTLVLDQNLCKKCLQKHGRKCHDSKFRACGVSGCELKHNPLLHNKQRHAKFEKKLGTQKALHAGNNHKSDGQQSNSATISSKPSNTHQVSCETELSRIVPIVLYNKGNSVKTFAFLDEGSSYTLMEKETADQLNVEGIAETICLLWTNGIHRQEETLRVDIQIGGIGNADAIYPLRSVNVVEDLGLSPQSVDPIKLEKRFKYLEGVPLQEYSNAIPKILIGLRHIRLTTPLETIEGGENEPIVSRSRLGWTVYGPIDGVGPSGYANHHKVTKCPCGERDEDLHKMVKDHFTIENFGVSINSMNMESKENQKVLNMMKQFTIRKGNRFETRLLWKNDAYVLPDSYGMARKRLVCVENKGAKTINLINDVIEDYLAKGYASKLTPVDLEQKHPRTFYLPIFTVVNPKKPDKIRPVFDAAATVQGTSLNSTLFTGPDLLSPLVDILRRFREHKVAVTGDIREMFHQVMINEVDRHSQRFLWRNGDRTREPDVYQFNVMTFGAKCSPSSAQFVKNINAAEYEIEFPVASKSIIENHYVDDMLDGASTVEEAIKLINDVKLIHSKAGFEIRNFKSNSAEVLRAVGEPVEASKVDLVEENVSIERVLGMFWETKSDSFRFSLKYAKISAKILEEKSIPTKRELLRLIMSLFDPLGLISYYVIHAKSLLQDVWRSKIGWDEKLPENLHEKWYRWIELLPQVEKVKIPRWYSTKLSAENTPEKELHIFVDAGEEAFAAVAYLRVVDKDGVDCSLIGSKARVTPLKYLSIPRKELMAAVLGSRLINSVEKGLSLKIVRRIIWSDSITVLTWLHSEHKKYSQFVAHRVGEILESTNLIEWRWVPTKLNVADEATKWSKKPTFEASDRWFVGPDFLRQAESEWPLPKEIIPNSTVEEMKTSCSHSKLIIESIVNATNFSTWQRLVRAVANAKRIAAWMVAKQKKLSPPSLKLTQGDLVDSERRLIRQAQWESLTEEMVILTRNKLSDPKKQKPLDNGSTIRDCSPYLDEFGILRVKGRIDSATAVTTDAKRPIILPKNNPITRLIVLSYHVKFKHHNHESVVNELRQKYYIPQIRTVVRSVRWNCKLCELRRCKPKPPQMADLPAIRFEAGIRPFTYTGIDYFGPLSVKVGRQTHKRWGVLYTCLTIRAIWIDVVPAYDTTSCIFSIRDFINRKGVVQEFYSDNGSYFKGADNELTREIQKIDQQRLSDEFTSCYTKWYFNPPETPHMGGMWERLIGAVKVSLNESMITRTPTDQMLKSWLIEAENIVNSRPLTFVPLDSEEDEALTPNHFIFGSSNGMKPPGNFRIDGQYLRDQWKEVQRCSDKFWKRFLHEYIPTLVRKTKWFDKTKPLEVGDLVINFDEDAPRNTYKRARVVETIIGSNQQVRRAKIQFGNGRTLWRSAHKLGLLDVKAAPTKSICLNQLEDDKNRGENVGAAISINQTPSNDAQSVESTIDMNGDR